MIRVEGLTKDFRTYKGAGFLLGNISFNIPERKLVAILGTNGSGKSTLLKILSGAMNSDSGRVIYEQNGVNSLLSSSIHESLRTLYLDQDAGRDLVHSMTIAENLFLAEVKGSPGSLRFPNRRGFRDTAENALARITMGLEKRMQEQVRFLSGGEKQGLILSRALLFQSKFLLLDEFVSALSRDLAAKMLELVRDIVKGSDVLCLLVTHEIDFAFRFADRLLFLHNGKLLANVENDSSSQRKVISLYAECLKEYIADEP